MNKKLAKVILVVGDYKTGKTVSACTFPRPALLLDWDNGFTSVKYTTNKDGSLVVPDWGDITLVEFYKESAHNLEFKTEFAPKGGGSSASGKPSHVSEAPTLVAKYNELMKSLYKDNTWDGKGPFKTVIVDSLTTMFRIWKEAILFYNNIPALRIPDYGTLEGILLGQFMPTVKSLPVEWVVLVDHIDMDKDELTGAIIEFPVGPSRSMGRGIGKEVDEIWRQREEAGQYVWRTRKSGFFQAGSRLNLPDPIPANFRDLEKFLRK